MINTEVIRGTFSLSAISASYATPFKVISSSYAVVKLIRTSDDAEVVLSESTDYTITGVGDDSATISLSPYETANNVTDWTTYDTGPWQLLVTLNIPITQLNDYKQNGRLSEELIENDFDKLYQIIQLAQLGIDTDGSSLVIAWPDNEPTGTSGKLPSQAERNGKLAGWDAVTGEWVAIDLDSDTIGGLTGPASQVEDNICLYASVQGTLKQESDIAASLFRSQTLVYGATVNWDSSLGHIATLNLSGDPTLNVTNIKPGVYKLLVNQDATGGRTITFNTGFGNTSSVALNTDSSGFSSLSFTSDGTTVYFDGSSSAAQATAGLVGTYQDFAYDISAVEDDIGYLRCNGQTVSRTKYADLFAVLGTSYNIGGEAGTDFRLPDLETDGRFRRASATVGTIQTDTTAVNGLNASTNTTGDHTHTFSETVYREKVDTTTPSNDVFGDQNTGTPASELTTNSAGSHSHTVSLGGDSETRPNNISVMVGIKF